MNLICGIVEFLLVITYGRLVFGFDQFPIWATKYLNQTLNATHLPHLDHP